MNQSVKWKPSNVIGGFDGEPLCQILGNHHGVLHLPGSSFVIMVLINTIRIVVSENDLAFLIQVNVIADGSLSQSGKQLVFQFQTSVDDHRLV